MKKLVFAFLLAAIGLFAFDANVSGKWSGTFTMMGPGGETKDTTALLDLKQTGKDITGTVGPDENERFSITKGKIESDKITLEVDHEGHTIKFELVLASERIRGNVNISEEGEIRTAKLDVGRVK